MSIWRLLFPGFIFVVWVVSTLISILFWPLKLLFGNGGDHVDPEILAEYQRVTGALANSDIEFLEQYAQTNPNFPHGKDDFVGRYWLTNAIDLGSVETVQWFLDQGCEVNYQDDEGYSPLQSAIERDEDSLNIIERLVQAGADINAKGTLNLTPLHAAAVHGSPEVLQYLLDLGADPFAWDTDYTPSQPIDFANQNPDNAAVLRDHMDKLSGADKGNKDA